MSTPIDLKMSEFPAAGAIDFVNDYVPIVRLVAGAPENLLAPVATLNVDAGATGPGTGGGAVSSVFGRTGAVVSAFGDYDWFQISGPALPPVNGANVTNLNANNLATGTVPPARMPPITNAMLAGGITSNKLVGTDINTVGTITTGVWNATPISNTFLGGGITADKLVGTDIDTVGTITTGVWHGTPIDPAHGGTGLAAPLTQGSVVFAGAGGVFAENNTNLFWDNTAARLGIGNKAPAAQLDVLSASGNQLRLTYQTTPVPLYSEINTGAGGILTIKATTGSINFATLGNQIDPAVGYKENLGSLQKKYLGIYGAELWVETLVAQNTIATIGGRILVGPTTTLVQDLAPGATQIVVKHNQIVATQAGDILVLQANGQIEFMRATAGPTGTGPYTYTVVRNLQGTGAKQWLAGDAVFNTGQTGQGFIDLYSLWSLKHDTGVSAQSGPTIVGNVRNSVAYNDWSEHWAIGSLNGIYGYGDTLVCGVGLGKYAANANHITIDAAFGFRIFKGLNTVVGLWDVDGSITVGQVGPNLSNILISAAGMMQFRTGSTVMMQFNADGSGSMAGGQFTWNSVGNVTMNNATIIAGGNNVTIDSTGINLKEGTINQASINWRDAANYIVSINGDLTGTGSSSDATFQIQLNNQNQTKSALLSFSTAGGLYVPALCNFGAGQSLDASACFQINSTTKGFLLPRLDQTSISGIAAPANGLLLYNTQTHTLNLRANGVWRGVVADVSVRVQIYASATTVPNNTQWPVTFDFANFDTDTHWSVGTGNTKLIIKYAGKYLLQSGVTFFGAAAGYRQLTIRINGTGAAAQTSFYQPSASQGSDLATSAVVVLNAGDYVETIAFQNSGAGLQIVHSNSNTNYSASYMSAFKIG